MPSTSKAQAKLMNIAAHTKGGYGGVPQKVGAEFHAADKAKHAKRESLIGHKKKKRAPASIMYDTDKDGY